MNFYAIKIVSEWRIYSQIILKSRSWVHGFLCDLEPGEPPHLLIELQNAVLVLVKGLDKSQTMLLFDRPRVRGAQGLQKGEHLGDIVIQLANDHIKIHGPTKSCIFNINFNSKKFTTLIITISIT